MHQYFDNKRLLSWNRMRNKKIKKVKDKVLLQKKECSLSLDQEFKGKDLY
ncbi:polysaccharide biosynthesis protein [Flavobacterium gilvum]|nr:polysaccharide biosynthesis protein [Flavobacterium gilvum]